MKLLTLILSLLDKLFTLWQESRLKAQGAKELAEKLKEAQDEKIKNANNAASGNLSDELLIHPKKRKSKK